MQQFCKVRGFIHDLWCLAAVLVIIFPPQSTIFNFTTQYDLHRPKTTFRAVAVRRETETLLWTHTASLHLNDDS